MRSVLSLHLFGFISFARGVAAFSARTQLLQLPAAFEVGSNESKGRFVLHAATVGSPRPDPSKPRRRPTLNEQLELDTIREELIQKYCSLGHSEEYATREVDYFLEDSERSAQYVEMRRVAMARGEDFGIETIVQFGGAFLLGVLGSWMMDSWNTYFAANPDGGLPLLS